MRPTAGNPEQPEIDPLPPTRPARGFDIPNGLSVLLLLVVSIGFESLFIDHGLNAMDEGWPLHAAMEMQHGKTLYEDVFWVFPPGHVLPAWIAYKLNPPGLIGARIIYAGFGVALTLGLFFIARRLMPADFALLAGLLAAVAAPQSHSEHLLFGFRYLALCCVVLLLYYKRRETGDPRWLFLAGIAAGVALFFRLTPAFAVSAAVGIGIVASTRDWRRWFKDGLWYSAGLVLFWIPVLGWFQYSIGLERLWLEMVVRPIEMTALQGQSMPKLFMPDLERTQISFAFFFLSFRLYLVMYVVFAVGLLIRWGRALRMRRPFEDVELLTFVVFGGIYFSRSLGRSDVPHLESAIPPIAVLIAYCASLVIRIPAFRRFESVPVASYARAALCVLVFGTWTFLNGSDRFLDQDRMMGSSPLESAGGATSVRRFSHGKTLDRLIPAIQSHSEPDEKILVLTHAPLIYLLADRHSYGYNDFVMPGTFRTEEDERIFLERVRSDPPAVVIWPRTLFDEMESRGLTRSAPRLSAWVQENYRVVARDPIYFLMTPRDRSEDR